MIDTVCLWTDAAEVVDREKWTEHTKARKGSVRRHWLDTKTPFIYLRRQAGGLSIQCHSVMQLLAGTRVLWDVVHENLAEFLSKVSTELSHAGVQLNHPLHQLKLTRCDFSTVLVPKHSSVQDYLEAFRSCASVGGRDTRQWYSSDTDTLYYGTKYHKLALYDTLGPLIRHDLVDPSDASQRRHHSALRLEYQVHKHARLRSLLRLPHEATVTLQHVWRPELAYGLLRRRVLDICPWTEEQLQNPDPEMSEKAVVREVKSFPVYCHLFYLMHLRRDRHFTDRDVRRHLQNVFGMSAAQASRYTQKLNRFAHLFGPRIAMLPFVDVVGQLRERQERAQSHA